MKDVAPQVISPGASVSPRGNPQIIFDNQQNLSPRIKSSPRMFVSEPGDFKLDETEG